MKIAGVYKITNKITGEFYIGSSKNIESRWANHKSPSVWELYPNVKLYKAMAQYGKDKFTIEVIEETDNLKEREQYYIEQLSPTYNGRYADGIDTERRKETTRRCVKEWHKANRNEHLTMMKDYYYTHRDKQLTMMKAYNNRVCLYEGEILTLGALSKRFSYQGIPHPYKEAKKYLL